MFPGNNKPTLVGGLDVACRSQRGSGEERAPRLTPANTGDATLPEIVSAGRDAADSTHSEEGRVAGDQRGVPHRGPPRDVICVAPVPSLLHTQISSWPERFEWKAIRVPSGENCALASSRVDEQIFCGERRASATVRSSCQIFRSSTAAWTDAKRLACRETLGLATSSPANGMSTDRRHQHHREPPTEMSRRNAMARPSDDQAGL